MKTLNKIPVVFFIGLLSHQANAEEEKNNVEAIDDLIKLTPQKNAVDQVKNKTLSDRAFESIKEEMFGVSPEQMREVYQKEQELKDAVFDRKPPKPITNIINLSTKPGAHPKEVYVSRGYITSLNIFDSTGQPWPITSVVSGDKDNFIIEKVEEHKLSNIIRVSPKRTVGSVNVNFTLADMPSALSITLVASMDKFHPTPIIQIDKEGPQAKTIVSYNIGNVTSDEILKNIVLGIAPNGAKKLSSSDTNVEAWKYEGSIYFRSSYQLSSPLPRGIHHGPSGFAAYRISDIPVIVMTTDNGVEKRITLTSVQ